jgi:uncharacterized protein (TIGR02217 family)
MKTFPTLPGIAFPIKRTPVWSTAKLTALSGRESRIPRRLFPLWKYELPFELLRSGAAAEFEQLVAFYNAVGGSSDSWLFNDPSDNTATAQAFGTGDGSTKQFQLYRALGGFSEPVFAATITSVTVAGVATSAYTLGSYGKLTFTTAPANGAALAWTGTFTWMCRFDDDTLEFQQFMPSYWSAAAVTFTTIKP